MGKMVSATEFKAKCLKLIEDMQKDGQPVTITRYGRVVAEMTPKNAGVHRDGRASPSVFGLLRSPAYSEDWDHEAPAGDASDWAALRENGNARAS